MIVSGSGRQRGICVISVHTISSLPPPYSSFLRTLRPVQFENGNPLFHLKLGSLAIILRKGNYLPGQQLVPSLITVQQEPKCGCQLRTWTPRKGPFACRTSDQQHFNIHHTKFCEQEPSNVPLCGNESWFCRSSHGGCAAGDFKAARNSVLVLLEDGR